MCNTKRHIRCFIWIVMATVFLILLTRIITLTYNRKLHPDEHVFYHTVTNLATSIMEPGTPFVENKEYPEGTYYFQLPFQLAGQILRNIANVEGIKGAQQIGRLASVFYYIIAVLLGLRLLRRYMGKHMVSIWIYGLTMAFSLFFIEQSRYGTGDIISLMLLMLLINLTAQALESDTQTGWWIAAFFISGILGAVKYPQLIFAIIPLTVFLLRPSVHKGRRLALFLLIAVAGFFLFSPKTMLDPGYILRVIQREGDAYLSATYKTGGPANHLLNLCLYLLIYSDFPLLPVVVLAGFVPRFLSLFPLRKTVAVKPGTVLLFEHIVPGVCLLFFACNLFVSNQFFRTYTPFFGVLIVYTAAAAEALFSKNKWGKAAVIFLAVCMILRGIGFVWVLSDDNKVQEKLSAMVAGAVDENWKETWYTSLFSFHISEETGVSTHDYHFVDPLVEHNNSYTIQPGQLVITGAKAFHLGQPYLLPVREPCQKTLSAWSSFAEANQDYFVGQLYPNSYYYLFGGWIRGSTLSQYEMPCHYIYYRGQ